AADYIVTVQPNINAGGTLTIDDDVNVKFGHGKYIGIYGTLNANGTSGRNGILFTRRDIDDEWYGLHFQPGSSGTLSYCTIEQATYFTSYGIFANNPTSLNLDHCLLHNNDYGFYGIDTSPIFLSNNQIINNSQYGIYLEGNCIPVFGSELAEWNDIYGNTTQDLKNGYIDITVGYVYWGTEIYSEIEDRIYHEADLDTLGLVYFFPYTNAAHDMEYFEPFAGPLNLIIWVEDDTVHLSWDPVVDAISYKVYSSDDPYSGFTEDTSGVFIGESWTTAVINIRKYYWITAIRD
ncbi:MAG: right-handed parallel beta-helix repeat-containing protein, partial [Candidatus Cloacimonetes bacterium]|nr:right-handed parallel beta-helix repeat-containing protein [Candidatus Cloacimonadota bacterium]